MNLDQWTNQLIKKYGKDAEVEDITGYYDETAANIICIIRKKEVGKR